MKLFFNALLLCMSAHIAFGQNVESFGIFGGLNVPFTVDQGLHKDPRFFPKVVLKGTPIGLFYGYDKSGYGFAVTPSYTQLGQKFTVRNVQGGEVGTRDVQLSYITVPVALKIHINDLSFFRLSLVASVAPSYLFTGKEVLNAEASELKYPAGVTVPTGYTVAYDGVYVPKIENMTYVPKNKFNAFQIFGAIGLRSDFDLSDTWSINFDGRANFGILDARSSSYVTSLQHPDASTPDYKGNPGAPDLYGSRRDFYLSAQIGICRIINTKEKFQAKHSGKIVFKKSNNARKPLKK